MRKMLFGALAAAMAVTAIPVTASAQFGPPEVRERVVVRPGGSTVVRRQVIEEPAEREVIVRRRVVPLRFARIDRGEVCRVRREEVVRPNGRVVERTVRVCR